MVKETILNLKDDAYEAPETTVIEVKIEQGFALSTSGTIEDVPMHGGKFLNYGEGYDY